jgi:hypothetical protein
MDHSFGKIDLRLRRRMVAAILPQLEPAVIWLRICLISDTIAYSSRLRRSPEMYSILRKRANRIFAKYYTFLARLRRTTDDEKGQETEKQAP